MRAPSSGRSSAKPRSVLRWAGRAGAVLALLAGSIEGTQDAVANGDTRSLSIFHEHTRESATITFKRNGRYDSAGLEQLNWILRDWRVEERAKMDPRLFDTVWELYRSVGAAEPIHIISAYRSPRTNAMLRARSRRVSEHSQHMQGKAMDLRLPDVPVDTVRAAAMRIQHGGVGYYAGSFVHVDVGSVRAWPRMSRDQLVRLFPDGKTVHLPADGKPLPGYEQARAELLARGVTVLGYTQVASAEEGGIGKSLWSMLFGRKDDEDSEFYAAQGRGRGAAPATQLASRSTPEESGARGALAFAAPETTAAVSPASLAAPAAQALWFPAGSLAVPAASDLETSPFRLGRTPLPPRRPEEFVALAALVSAPIPPARPIQMMASADPDALPLSSGLRLETASPSPDSTRAPAELKAAASDRNHLRALFAAVPTSTRRPGQRVVIAAMRRNPGAEIPAGMLGAADTGLNIRFSAKPGSEPSAGRFAGPAVASLASLR